MGWDEKNCCWNFLQSFLVVVDDFENGCGQEAGNLNFLVGDGQDCPKVGIFDSIREAMYPKHSIKGCLVMPR